MYVPFYLLWWNLIKNRTLLVYMYKQYEHWGFVELMSRSSWSLLKRWNVGRLLSALICEYLDWAQLNHTLKVYQPESNLVISYIPLFFKLFDSLRRLKMKFSHLSGDFDSAWKHMQKPKDSWKSELRDFSSSNGYELNRNGDSGPLLLDVLEGFLKFEVFLSFLLSEDVYLYILLLSVYKFYNHTSTNYSFLGCSVSSSYSIIEDDQYLLGTFKLYKHQLT